jgi:type I restriction enzyme S subunit
VSIWSKEALGAICDVNIGRTPARNRSDFWGKGHAWLSIADMNQGRDLRTTKETITDLAIRECNCRPAQPGTVLLSFKLSIGKVGIAQIPLFTNEAIAALPIQDKARLSSEYLYWALQSVDLTLGLDRAAKGLTLNKAKLLETEIPLPPLAEQRRIAEVLDKAEALRAKRRAALAQLDSLTQSLFLDLFGDPVVNLKKWDRRPFSELLEAIDSGWSPVCLDRPTTGSEWGILKLGAVTRCEYNALENKALPANEEPDPSLEVKAGDLLFTRKNTYELVAACAFVRTTPPKLMMSDLIFRLRTKDNAPVDKVFLQNLLVYPSKRSAIQKLASGSSGSMPNISKARLLTVPIELPPLGLQHEFARRVAAVEKLKTAQRAALAELDGLFASLQHRAFRGEL